jgi:hypothetical protein
MFNHKFLNYVLLFMLASMSSCLISNPPSYLASISVEVGI